MILPHIFWDYTETIATYKLLTGKEGKLDIPSDILSLKAAK
jgi:hypothetical protein